MAKMAKGKPISNLVSLAVWITGILVSLAVGFGMIGEGGVPILTIMYLPNIVTVIAGWIVVVLTIVSVVLAIADRF